MNILYTFNNWLASYILLVIVNIAVNPHTKIVQNNNDKYSHEKVNQETTNSDS